MKENPESEEKTGRRALRIALPNKGRLSEPAARLVRDAGYSFENNGNRLWAKCANYALEILFLRADDIAEYVQDDVVDFGITGLDLVEEKSARVNVLEKLGFGKCRLSVAAPKGSGEGLAWLGNKRVATSFPRLAKEFFSKRGVTVELVELRGSVELAPRLGGLG